MSGIEVVAAVGAILSAVNGSVNIYRSWQEKRRERKQNQQNQQLEQSLVLSSSAVQSEYDQDYAKLGQRFATGDDIGRAEIATYVIKLQHLIITMMGESSSALSIVMPSLPSMLSTSNETRVGVVNVLAQQYQRMMQAATIPAPLSFNARVEAAMASRTADSSWNRVPEQTLAPVSFRERAERALREDNASAPRNIGNWTMEEKAPAPLSFREQVERARREDNASASVPTQPPARHLIQTPDRKKRSFWNF